MGLTWNGNAILAKIRQAEVGGVKDTVEAVVNEAKERVREDSGDLKASIKVLEEASASGEGVSAQVGSELEYAAIQELGPEDANSKYGYTPYLRPAMDIHGKQLAANIKKRM